MVSQGKPWINRIIQEEVKKFLSENRKKILAKVIKRLKAEETAKKA